MKVLVTGSSGFIGQNMVKLLRSKGHKVITADLPGQDLRDITLCKKLTKVDWVFHFAAKAGGFRYINRKNKIPEYNHQLDMNIISACILNNTRLFYPSSSCVYPIGNPENSYGQEKYDIEMILKRIKLKCSIARICNPYGPGAVVKGIREQVVQSLCRQAIKGKIKVYGDGTQRRRFIYIDDLCNQILYMMEKKVKFADLGGAILYIKDIVLGLNILYGQLDIEYGNEKYKKRPFFPSVKYPTKISLIEGLRLTTKWIRNLI